MPVTTSIPLSKTLPYAAFERLKVAIADLGQSLESNGIVLTETLVNPSASGTEAPFVIIVSPDFRLLLRTTEPSDGVTCQTELTFDPQPISAFLKKLRTLGAKLSRTTRQPEVHTQIKQALLMLTEQPAVGASMYEKLVHHLVAMCSETLADNQSQPSALTCQPIVDAALEQQFQQERLLNQVTTQIRQSLELPVILQTAVDQVRACLNVDRLLIYQFVSQKPSHRTRKNSPPIHYGVIAYESCATPTVASLVETTAPESWSVQPEQYQRYGQGETVATSEVQDKKELLKGPVDLLSQGSVTAQLITPVQVQNELWGLLIAHQCGVVRHWEPRETEFLDQIAEHLAIAIHQAQLYQQLQTQKQTLEEQVAQRTQELRDALLATQSANRVKSEFLSTMNHELRTPLTCVIGMSATLMRWSLGPLNDKQRGYLQTIHDSGEHLLELINDILDLSQTESGKATLNLSDFSLTALAQQSIQMLRDKANAGQITLKTSFKIPLDRDRFVADPRRVKQILFNLLSNAIKFTPPGGEVCLRVWLEPNTAVFQVEDTGIGIAASQQPLLFQKFQQLDPSYRRTYEGTGLGLALTKQLVDLHRGWIEVTSTEGKGSTFRVELPNQSTAGTSAHLPSTGSAHSHLNTRIVLIEDNEESATLICEILTAAGYHVIWIVEHSTALEQIRFLQPSAAIISIDPTENGGSLDLIQQFRQKMANRRLKIITLAPQSLAQDPQRYLAVGADTVLSKPLNPEHLVHKVDMLLSNADL